MGQPVNQFRILNPMRTKIAVCEALGLDASRIKTLTIILDEGMPRAIVEYLLFSDQSASLGTSLREGAILIEEKVAD